MGDVEFVHDVSGSLPSQVVGELMGIPAEDWDQIRDWAEQSTSGQDPELAGDGYAGGAGLSEMALYAYQFAVQRRQEEPREDLASLILAGNFGDGPMDDVQFASFFVQLVTAGNDTTKTMLSSGTEVLLAHPDQLRDVRCRPGLIPGAGRGDPPLRQPAALLPAHRHGRHRARTACRSPQGDKVAMMYTSANRDEAVFGDTAQQFDIRRITEPAPVVRLRAALLPRGASRPARRAGCSSTSC